MNRVSGAIIAVLAVALGCETYFLCCPPDKPAATYVGGRVMMSELDKELKDRYGSEVLEEIITARLIKQAIERKKISLSDAELDQWVADYKERPDAQEILASNQFDEKKLRKNLQTSVPLYYLALGNVPEADRERYFNDNKARFQELNLRHIVLSSEEEALELRDRINGEDTFMAMALVHSLDDQTTATSGALGRVTRAELLESFNPLDVDALFSLKPGDISLPVQASGGAWHLFFVRSVTTDYEHLRLRVVEELAQRKLELCLKNLRDSAKVELFFPEPATNAATGAKAKTDSAPSDKQVNGTPLPTTPTTNKH